MKINGIDPQNDRYTFSERTLKIFEQKVSTTDLDGAYVNTKLPSDYKVGDVVKIPGTKKFISDVVRDIKMSAEEDGTKCGYKAEITCNNGYTDPETFKLDEGKYSNVLMHDCFDYLNGVVNWKSSVIKSYAQDTLDVIITQIAMEKRNLILKAINDLTALPSTPSAVGDTIHEQILYSIMKLRQSRAPGPYAVVMKESVAYELMKTTLKDVQGNLQIINNDPTELQRVYGAVVKTVPDEDLIAPFITYPPKSIQYYEACMVQPSIRAVFDSDKHDGTARIYQRRLRTVRGVGEETVQYIDKDNNIINKTFNYFVKGTLNAAPFSFPESKIDNNQEDVE